MSMMLTTRIHKTPPRKAKKPSGVSETMPNTIATHPSHFGSAPWRTIEIPVANHSTWVPSANGKKSLSHSACSVCTEVGSMSSAASAIANAIVPSIAAPSAMIVAPTSASSDSIPPSHSAARRTFRT